jgi:hypothetical protein
MTINTLDNNGLNIRGGTTQENYYTIDGIEFKNINHYATEIASGAIGFITADNVKLVRINTVMQPSLLSRNSSVIEIELKDVPPEKIAGQLDLNISGVSFQMQGTTEKQNPAFLSNFRWMDMKPLEMFTRGVWSQYGDALLKGTVTLDDNHSIGLISVISYDKTRTKTTWDRYHPDAQYQKELLLANSGLYHAFDNGKVHNRLTLSAGLARDEFFQEKTDTFWIPVWKDTSHTWRDTNFTIKKVYENIKLLSSYDQRIHFLCNEVFSCNLSDNIALESGLRFKAIDCTNHEMAAWSFEYGDSVPSVFETGAYVQGKVEIDKFTILTGVRSEYFTSIDDLGVAPYLGLIYDNEKYGAFKLQCAYSFQEPPVFQRYYPWFFIRFYTPSDVALQRCIQGSLLFEKNIRKSHAFSAEVYCKYYNQDYPYSRPYKVKYDTDAWIADTEYTRRITEANGKKIAAGMEVCLHNTSETMFRYRLALSVGKIKNRFTDYKWYDDENDIRAALKLTLSTLLRKHHDLSLTWLAADGRPYSSIDPLTPRSEWFTKRFDPTLFLSVRYSLIYTGKKIAFGAYLDVQNVLNQTHAVAMQEVDRTRMERKMDGILPTAGLKFSF